MSVSRKVFIYNGKGASSESADDLNTFMRENHDIFSTKPDIDLCSFSFNPDGLECPLFIVPGGSTSVIGSFVRPFFNEVRESTVGSVFNYVGVCAGSMVGVSEVDLFLATTKFDSKATYTKAPGTYHGRYSTNSFCTGIVKANSIGSFYPLAEVRNSDKNYTPYRVNLKLNNGQVSTQLFVGSPGFDPAQLAAGVEVVATYTDRESYPFLFPEKPVKEFATLPAIIRQAPCNNKGGRVLCGPHFETCVKSSKMLRFFKEPSNESDELYREDYDALEAAQEKTSTFMRDLLITSLK